MYLVRIAQLLQVQNWGCKRPNLLASSSFINEDANLVTQRLREMFDAQFDDDQEHSDVLNQSDILVSSGGRSRQHKKRKDNGWSIAGTDIVPFHKFDPDVVYRYCNSSSKDGGKRDLKTRVRQHLASLGWKIEFQRDGERDMIRMRYISPQGKVFMSLVLVCKALLSSVSLHSPVVVSKKVQENHEEVVYEREYNHEALAEYISIKKDDHAWYKKTNVKDIQLKVRKHLSFLGWKFWYSTKRGKRELQYCSPRGKIDISLITICKQCINEGVGLSRSKEVAVQHESIGKPRKDSERLISKRVRQGNSSTSSCSNPRTVLSWLIDNNVVLPRAKAYYISRKDQNQLAEGRITREGIKCSCCEQVFTLSKFESHSGTTSHRPAANIFLDDGRSLLECQSQLRRRNELKSLKTKPKETTSDDTSGDNRNDNICSICRHGGELVLCDKCPSSYHIECLGLKVVPDDDWFCPSCCCGSCGRHKLFEDANEVENESFLHYHVECLKERAHANSENVPIKSCFCSKKCEMIFLELESRVGKCVSVGENLTWTLWKCGYSSDGHDNEGESYGKLNVALNVMHECFEPVKDTVTERDIVEDVIFSRRYELSRLNFEGFFTVILEKNDELVSVANIRIHGEKVAEMPLVATRFEYRRSGMCRILINEIEKMLMELGIQQIVLPAIPSVVNTWKNAFGFSEMTEPEKLMFLNHTFLNFEGTIMCQKQLRNESLIKVPLLPTSENVTEIYKVTFESNDKHESSSNNYIPLLVANAELEMEKFKFDRFDKEFNMVNEVSEGITIEEGKDPPLMTEDMHEERIQAVEALGDSFVCKHVCLSV
ncbi:uncharacterized protein LOC124934575 [Impatiens glandulifera]|uniref:uncharacterized protein LOC124934575 n=1 Tax=Impatiens glandulifera TaxID=253017 RepID=UPI001FB0D8A0|nr:uncharacterized protein LOC124934575 [Impatiens glandulifera]